MSDKRSKRKNAQQFYCPYCQRWLWRLGSPKHFLFYIGASEIQQHVEMSRKHALLLATQGEYIDSNCWIEEFICEEHGKFWMKITRKIDRKLVMRLATSKDWQQTTRTIQPNTPNPSVSEFSYRMSRQTGRKYYDKQ